MLRSVNITNPASNEYNLVLANPWASGINIFNIDGLGPPNADIYMVENAFYDGARYTAARLQKRTITFSILFTDVAGVRTIQDCRRLSYEIFPIKQRIRMRFNTEDNIYEIYGYVESNTPNIFSNQEGTIVSVVCPDPYFRNINEGDTVDVEFVPSIGAFVFPFYREPDDEDIGKQIIFSERTRPLYNIINNMSGIDTGVELSINFTESTIPLTVTPVLQLISLDNIGEAYDVDNIIGDQNTFILNFNNGGTYWDKDTTYKIGTIPGSRYAKTVKGSTEVDHTLEAYREGNLNLRIPTGQFALVLDFKPKSTTDADYYTYAGIIKIHMTYPNRVQGI